MPKLCGRTKYGNEDQTSSAKYEYAQHSKLPIQIKCIDQQDCKLEKRTERNERVFDDMPILRGFLSDDVYKLAMLQPFQIQPIRIHRSLEQFLPNAAFEISKVYALERIGEPIENRVANSQNNEEQQEVRKRGSGTDLGEKLYKNGSFRRGRVGSFVRRDKLQDRV